MHTCTHICWSPVGRRWARGRRRDSCRVPRRSRPGRPSAASSDRSRAAAASTPGPPSPAASVLPVWLKVQRVFFNIFFIFYLRYSTLLHLPPLIFHCVGECWDRTQYSCDYDSGCQDALTTRPDLIHNLHFGRKTQEGPNKNGRAAEPKNEVGHIKEFLSMFFTWISIQTSD